MARRRGRGEGSIVARRDGRWMGRLSVGRDAQGRRQRKTVYGPTRAAVAKELNRLLGRIASGEPLVSGTPTLATWLDQWVAAHQHKWRASTRRTYRAAITRWIVPSLGSTRLERLTPSVLQAWVARETVARPRAYVVLSGHVLRGALHWAMHQRLLTYNPMDSVEVPRPQVVPCTPLSVADLQRVLEAAHTHRLGGAISVTALLGLRLGEVSGLSWEDVDLDHRRVRIRQQLQAVPHRGLMLTEPKSQTSRRRLALPAIAVEALQRRRVQQQEERLRAGSTWSHAHDLIFTTPTGGAVSPDQLRYAFKTILRAAGVPPVKFHGLRHGAATMLLGAGVPLFDVSRVLGHSQIGVTADIYGHLVEDMAAGAAQTLDRVLSKP